MEEIKRGARGEYEDPSDFKGEWPEKNDKEREEQEVLLKILAFAKEILEKTE